MSEFVPTAEAHEGRDEDDYDESFVAEPHIRSTGISLPRTMRRLSGWS